MVPAIIEALQKAQKGQSMRVQSSVEEAFGKSGFGFTSDEMIEGILFYVEVLDIIRQKKQP